MLLYLTRMEAFPSRFIPAFSAFWGKLEVKRTRRFGRGSAAYDRGTMPCTTHWIRGLVVLAGVALVAGCRGGEPEGHPAAGAVAALAEEALREHPAVGASVAVELGGETVFEGGFGFADLEHRVAATAETVYRIGSVTKQFTAAAVMLLVEEGALDLEADLAEVLPDYDTAGFRVRVEQLLNHTSGIKGYTEMETFWEQARLDLGHEAMTALFSSVPFEFEPGDRYQYNNSGYYLLGMIVERLSGQTYTAFLEERLFRPLGLGATHYLDNDPIVPHRAEGYEAVSGGGFRNDDPLSMRLPYAAGSLGASAPDLLRWQRALVGGEAVSADSYAAMTTRGRLTGGDEVAYGYGLGLGEEHGLARIAHGGGINGFRAQLSWYPEAELGIAVLMNSGSGRPGVLENRIARAVLGMEQPELREVPMAAAELEPLAGTYDAGRSPAAVRFEAGSLHALGQRLVPVGNGVFHPEGDPFTRVEFEVGEDGRGSAMTVTRAGNPVRSRRVE